jgi:hypothetical protein
LLVKAEMAFDAGFGQEVEAIDELIAVLGQISGVRIAVRRNGRTTVVFTPHMDGGE